MDLRAVETEDVFHYTSADAALAILSSLELRLGSFETTNDLREAREHFPGLSAHEDDIAALTDVFSLAHDMDWWLRRFVKVGCFTRDYDLHDHSWDQSYGRGWAHPALWAHYGGGHTGMCLRFNRPRLIETFLRQLQGLGRLHAGDVYYPRDPIPEPSLLDAGQINEFGLDAALIAYMEHQRKHLLFTKHEDWASEQEFRLIFIGASLAPLNLSIRDCLTGIFFGDSCAQTKEDVAHELLQDLPDVQPFRIRYFNRSFTAMPAMPGAKPPSIRARRPGDLAGRLDGLQRANADAAKARKEAEALCVGLLAELEVGIGALRDDMQGKAPAAVELHKSVYAIPPAERARAAGVAGEVVNYQSGLILTSRVVLGEHTSQEFVAAVAIQVLQSGVTRTHAAVVLERIDLGGREDWEPYRERQEVGPGDRVPAEALLAELRERSISALETFAKGLNLITASRTDTACLTCQRPLEPVARNGEVAWRCDYCGPHEVEK